MLVVILSACSETASDTLNGKWRFVGNLESAEPAGQAVQPAVIEINMNKKEVVSTAGNMPFTVVEQKKNLITLDFGNNEIKRYEIKSKDSVLQCDQHNDCVELERVKD